MLSKGNVVLEFESYSEDEKYFMENIVPNLRDGIKCDLFSVPGKTLYTISAKDHKRMHNM